MATPEVLNRHRSPQREQITNSSESGAYPEASRQRYRVLAAAFCGTFVGFGSLVIFTFGVFLKPLTVTFGWSRGQVSTAFTLTALSVAVCSPLIGRFLDRYPARRVIIPCTIVYAICFGSLSLLTKHLSHLFAVFVLMGMVGNGTTQLGYARVVSAWFTESRGRALATVMTGSAAGSMIFPPFAQWLISSFGWRSAYGVLAIVILLLAIPLTALFLNDPPGTSRDIDQEAQKSARLTTLLSSRAFLYLIAALILFSGATNGLQAHLHPFLTDRGIPASRAAIILSIGGFSTLSSRILIGYLLDRFVAARITALLFSVCALGFVLLIFAHSFAEMASGVVLVGIGLGAESDAVPYLLARSFGLGRFSELYAYTWSAYAFAGAMGPLLMGLTFDRTGSYRVCLSVFGAAILVSAILLRGFPNAPVTISRASSESGFR